MIKLISRLRKKHRSTIRNSFWRALQTIGVQGVTFIAFLICARLLEPRQFNEYSYTISTIFLLITFCNLGISKAVTKYVVEFKDLNFDKYRKIIFNSFLAIFTASSFVSIFIFFAGNHVFGEFNTLIKFLIPLLFIVPITALYEGILIGKKEFRLLALITLFSGGISLIVFYFLISKYGLYGAFIGQIFLYSLLLLTYVFNHRDYSFKYDFSIIKKIFLYSLLIGIANVGSYSFMKFDVIILGYYGYVDSIGAYSMVDKIMQLLFVPVLIVSTVVSPDSTKNFKERNFKKIKKQLINHSIVMFGFGVVVAIIAYLVLPILIRLYFSRLDVDLIQFILGLFLFILPIRFVSSYIGTGFITPGGFAKVITWLVLVFSLLNVIFDILLLNFFGFAGIVYSKLIIFPLQSLLILFTFFYLFEKNAKD